MARTKRLPVVDWLTGAGAIQNIALDLRHQAEQDERVIDELSGIPGVSQEAMRELREDAKRRHPSVPRTQQPI